MMLLSKVRPIFAVAVSAFVLSGCAGQPATVGSKTNLRPGQLLTVRPDRVVLPDSGEAYAFTYISESASGENTVVHGRLAIPKGNVPNGGFPVISWAPGTSGMAPQCAPSHASAFADGHLNEWLKRGYAAVMTDYPGWGASGPRPLLHGPSNAAAVVNAVEAAHAISSKLAAPWIAVGHSEGGGAVLWAAARTTTGSGKFPLKGAVAYAPTGPGVEKFISDAINDGAVGPGAQPFLALTALGAQAVDPSVNLKALIAEPMMPLAEAAKEACLGGLFRFPALSPGQYFRKGAEADKMMAYVKAQDPSALTMRVPVAIFQGEKDQTSVTPASTIAMVKGLCARSVSISYKEFAGQDHRGVVGAALADATGFATATLKGEPVRNDCR